MAGGRTYLIHLNVSPHLIIYLHRDNETTYMYGEGCIDFCLQRPVNMTQTSTETIQYLVSVTNVLVNCCEVLFT